MRQLLLLTSFSLFCMLGSRHLPALTPQEARLQMLENHLTDLQDTLRELTGRLEELEHKLTSAKQQSPLPSASAPPQNPALPSFPPTGAMKEESQGVVQYNEALDLLKASQFSKALLTFQSFAQDNPRSTLHGSALYWIGVIHVIQGQHSDALTTFQTLLKNNPSFPKRYDVFYKMVKTYQAQGQTEEARTTLRICLSQLEQDPEKQKFHSIASQIQALAQELEISSSHASRT